MESQLIKKPNDDNPLGETVPLLPATTTLDDSAVLSIPIDTQHQRLWEELNSPWPSTFERSIALLASPMINKQDVARFTQSPKPGATSIALARRNDLDRGYYHTPEQGIVGTADRRNDPSTSATGGNQGFFKVQSLDFLKNKTTIEAVQSA